MTFRNINVHISARWSLVFLLFSLSLLGAAYSYAQEGKAITFDKITVTATRTAKEISSVPASTDIVTDRDIEGSNVQAVDQAMDTLPSVYDRRGKGLMDTQASITLRGVPEQKRTLIMVDGVPMNRAYDGTVSFANIPVQDVEKIEVVRGPFSSLYGGYAMGGVVNIMTKLPDKQEFTAHGGYGTYNTRTGYLSYGNKFKEKLRLFVSYGYQSTDGYVTDYNLQTSKPTAGINGWALSTNNQGAQRYLIGDKGDNGWRQENITIKAGYDFSSASKLRLSYIRGWYEYDYGPPNTYLANAAGSPIYTYGTVKESSFLSGSGGVAQNIYRVGYENSFSDVKTNVSLSLNEYEKSWYVTPDTTATQTGGAGKVSSTPSRAYDIDLQFTVPLFTRHLLTAGGSYRYNWAETKENKLTSWKNEDSTTDLTYRARGRDRTYALFLQDEISLIKKMSLYLGLRQDWWAAFDGYANDVGKAGYPQQYGATHYSSLSPKAAIVYKPLDVTTLRTSIGKAFRPPTVYDLYRTWTSTTGTTYAGNPDLKPEKILSWDVGIEQKLWRGGSVKAAYFESTIDDLIYSRDIDTKNKDKINVGKAHIRGFEIEGQQGFDCGVRLFANYTYNDGKITDNDIKPDSEGKQLTYVPKEMFNVGVDYERGPIFSRVTGKYVGKRYTDDLNRDYVNNVYLSYDPYFVVDGKISWKAQSHMIISLSVNNIFDRDYFSSYKAPGRQWYGEVTLKF